MTEIRVGADVGGTFTDVVLTEADGSLSVVKVLSSPPRYDSAIVSAVTQLTGGDRSKAAAISEIVHGTTVATNAVLEHRGAVTALVTTRGFGDVLELRRMRIPELYDPSWTKPKSLVPRQLRFEVGERVLADGTVLTPLDEEELARVADDIRAASIEAVAVCFLHAHKYPMHEALAGDLLRRALPGVSVSVSSEVLREAQEYERCATTVINAYVRPLMDQYIGELREGLRGVGVEAPLNVMRSSGGKTSDGDACARPVYVLESGPAAGVIAAGVLATELGFANAVSFDMGGTTAKAALIEDGAAVISREYEVGAALSAGSRLLRGGGELIRVPTVDISEVGAGGGSIAALDPAGALRVGPESAGADPGPACYGRGGTSPTVTDANVALGLIPEGELASGALLVSQARARAALAHLAEDLGVDVMTAAASIHSLANSAMMRALRSVSSARGRDPRDLVMVAFGGSGPVHAAALASELGIRTVIVPLRAGVFSAVGLLVARTELEDVRFCRMELGGANFSELERLAAEMRVSLQAGSDREVVQWRLSADLRYRGQSWDLEIPWGGDLSRTGASATAKAFEAEHARLYGHRLGETAAIELRSIRVRASGAQRNYRFGSDERLPKKPAASQREILFKIGGAPVWVPVAQRADIPLRGMSGPVVVDEYDTSIVVPPSWRVSRRPTGTLILEA